MKINMFTFDNNENINTSNSIVYNNYSIQNVYISPPNFTSFNKKPMKVEEYVQKKQIINESAFAPVPKRINMKMNNYIHIPSNIIFNNFTPMPSKITSNELVYKKFEKNNLFKTPRDVIPKIVSIFNNANSFEKHPKDSVKKAIFKKKNINRNSNLNKNLKSSLSQGFYKKFKKPKSSPQNHLNVRKLKLLGKTSYPRNNLSKKRSPKNSKSICVEPKENINLKEYVYGEPIGKGTFANIFSVKWIKNNKYYAMKKEILYNIEDIQNRKKNFTIIQNFIKNTDSKGVIKLYGNLCLKSKRKIPGYDNLNEFIYYELMEKADRDWDNEINERSEKGNYYSEKEIFCIMSQLIETLSLLQKKHITHRDIKPQNILILNGRYKLCDFGEIRVLERAGLIVQRIRGSELYMSPILFQGLHRNFIQVKHNTYKSDVFSLGMCLFFACSLTYCGVDSIRELTAMNKIKEILFQYLNKRYSNKLISLILSMLEVDENKRMDFIKLEEKLKLLL
jgi:hypothetical protein